MIRQWWRARRSRKRMLKLRDQARFEYAALPSRQLRRQAKRRATKVLGAEQASQLTDGR